MINFFRRIRYDLMGENQPNRQATKTGKPGLAAGRYFKYAIGEVSLVVIGILIALSINNWNEEHKNINKGLDILIDVRENIAFNTLQFQEDIETNKDVINSIDILLHNLTVTKIYHDSIGKHLRYASWWASSRWKSSGYEALIFHGADVIQSKELSESIIDIYEIAYAAILENTRLTESNWSNLLPSWLALIYRDPTDFDQAIQHTARPFDYQELMDSRLFRSSLTFFRSQRIADNQYRQEAIEKHDALIILINQELSAN